MRFKGYPFEVQLPEGSAVSRVVLSNQLKSLNRRSRKVKFLERASSDVIAIVLRGSYRFWSQTLLPLSNIAMHLSRHHKALFFTEDVLRPGDGERWMEQQRLNRGATCQSLYAWTKYRRDRELTLLRPKCNENRSAFHGIQARRQQLHQKGRLQE